MLSKYVSQKFITDRLPHKHVSQTGYLTVQCTGLAQSGSIGPKYYV